MGAVPEMQSPVRLYRRGMVGSGSQPSPSAELGTVPPVQEGRAMSLTKSYPSFVRLGAMEGWSKRMPSSTTATTTWALPVVRSQARGSPMSP